MTFHHILPDIVHLLHPVVLSLSLDCLHPGAESIRSQLQQEVVQHEA
jgi:hypothetical protein